MAAQLLHHLLLGFLCYALVLLPSASSQPLEAIGLTDATFEHQTQSATGQTTGHWCVLFVNSSLAEDPWQVAAEDAWHTLAEDADKATIMAKVDVASNQGLAKRFGLSSTPAVRLFRDRGMYTISLAGVHSPDADKLAAAVTAFVEGGYEQQEAAAVPAEPSLLDVAKEAANKYVKVSPNPMLIAGVICLAFGGVLFIIFMSVGIWYAMPEKAVKQSPAAAAAAAAAKKTGAPAEAASAEGAAAAGAGAGAEPGGAGGNDADEAEVVKPAASRTTRRRA